MPQRIKTICFWNVLDELSSKINSLWGQRRLWEKLRGWALDWIWWKSDIWEMGSEKCQFVPTGHRHNFFQRAHSTNKVILFEQYSVSSFQKHTVYLCTDPSGRSCDGLKMTIFGEIGARPSRDLRDPRKKRPFLSTKFIFPLQAGKPLQIWAETVQWARRTINSKWARWVDQNPEIRKIKLWL